MLDPEIGINIVDLGLVYRIEVEGGRARIVMTMTSPACPLAGQRGGLGGGQRAVASRRGDLSRRLLVARVPGRWRSWGGLLNAFALLLFMLNTGRSIALGGNRGEFV